MSDDEEYPERREYAEEFEDEDIYEENINEFDEDDSRHEDEDGEVENEEDEFELPGEKKKPRKGKVRKDVNVILETNSNLLSTFPTRSKSFELAFEQ